MLGETSPVLVLVLGAIFGAVVKPSSPGSGAPSPVPVNVTECVLLEVKRPVLFQLVERESLECEICCVVLPLAVFLFCLCTCNCGNKSEVQARKGCIIYVE